MEESCQDVANVESDEGELWFSDDEVVDADCAQSGILSSWSTTVELSCPDARPPSQSVEKDLTAILDKVRLGRDDVAAVYLLGSHLFACATPSASHKLLIVVKNDALNLRHGERSKDGRHPKNNGVFRECFYLDVVGKKNGKHAPRQVRVKLEDVTTFERRLLRHKELLPVWLPDAYIWLETADLKMIRAKFDFDRVLLWKAVSSYCAFAAKRFDKYLRKEDFSNARRVVLNQFRVLLLSSQLAKTGTITNYSCQPEFGRLAGSLNGLEIMSHCDAREGRMNATEASKATSTEEHRIKTVWNNVCEPWITALQVACTCQIPVCKDDGEMSRSIPEAISEDACRKLCRQFPFKDVVSQLQHAKGIYETMQNELLEKCSSLKATLSELDGDPATVDADELLHIDANTGKTELESVEDDLAYVKEQLTITEMNISCMQAMGLEAKDQHQRPVCMIDFLINIDDVKKHSSEHSIPDYYLDLINYLGAQKGDAIAHPVWMDKGMEKHMCFSPYTCIFYKHMRSATFFEKNRDFEQSKFRRNQAVSAMTAPYTKKDGLTRILREYRGEVGGSHPADSVCSGSIAPTLDHSLKFEIQFEPGTIGLKRKGHRIIGVIEDSLAHQKGIKPGWLVDSIDGDPYTEALLKAKKDGEFSYTVGFVELCTRVSSVAADNIAPRSFNVGVNIVVDTAYDDLTSFEEEYARGLAIAVCRRASTAAQAAGLQGVSRIDSSSLVASPFGLDTISAAARILEYTSFAHQHRIYRLRRDSEGQPLEGLEAYETSMKELLSQLHATPMKTYDEVSSWRHQVSYAILVDQKLEDLLKGVQSWDPQMKTFYGADNLWILKPKGMGRGKGIFVAECARDIIGTPGLDHLFSAAGLPKYAPGNDNEFILMATAESEVTSTKFGGYGLTQVETGWVAQKYMERPLLFSGKKKFDIRFMALVSFVGNDQLDAARQIEGSGDQGLPWAQSITGGAHAGGRLTCYSFEDSVMKICAADFHDETEGGSELRHLTNHAVQEHHPLYNPEEGVQDSVAVCALGRLGSCIPLEALPFRKGHGDPDGNPEWIYHDVLLPQMRALAYRVFRATPWEKDWARDEGFYPTDVRFQLFGFDMMVDEDFRVWVIEVNQQPGLSAEGVPAMSRIMRKLLRGMFGILLDVERYDVICSSSVSSLIGSESSSARNQEWPASAAGWSPLESIYTNTSEQC